MKSELIKQIESYKPFNEQEKKDKEIILDCLKNNEEVFSRQSKMAHMTASAWVTNKNRDKILMVYHNLYDSWSWLGGHADGEENLLEVAMREVSEESGLKNLIPVSRDIYSLEVLTVDGHRKKGEYISSHLHLNVTYLLEADDKEILSIKPDENSGVAWFGLERAIESSTEKWFQENIYRKLNEKLKNIPEDNEIRNNLNIWEEKEESKEKYEEVLAEDNVNNEVINKDNIETVTASVEMIERQKQRYVKVYELDMGGKKSLFSKYVWKGKKQAIDISFEEYYDKAKKIAVTYGASQPTKTTINKDGKIMLYCRKAGKLSLEEDFVLE